MSEFQKATQIEEVPQTMEPAPLAPGDPRYQDTWRGRSTGDLRQIRELIEKCAMEGSFAKAALTGARGCGKSTELLRLKHDLGERFTCLHVAVHLRRDDSFAELLLSLADAVVRHCAEEEMPQPQAAVEDVVEWFAKVSDKRLERRVSPAVLGAEAKTEAGFLALLDDLKSAALGSSERRRAIRQRFQTYAQDLLGRVNMVLDEAQRALAKNGRPANLVLLVDNLDRLPARSAETLFFEHGDLLNGLWAHVVYTAPAVLALSPRSLCTVFGATLHLAMIQVREPSGRPARPGVEALVEGVGRRVEVGDVFHGPKVVSFLVHQSGGCFRHLIFMIRCAHFGARIGHKPRIDMASAGQVVARIRREYESSLAPRRAYFTVLARAHQNRGSFLTAEEQKVFRLLYFEGSMLDYDTSERWYGAHPIVQGTRGFREALADVRKEDS